MELSKDSRLYKDDIAATRLADKRLEPRTRAEYEASLRRFAAFCKVEGYPNPLNQRFRELPSVLVVYINRLAVNTTSQWPAEKFRAALAWHYSKPEMLAGGHPHDHWVLHVGPDGFEVTKGNPARSPMISNILVGVTKKKKRDRTPTRASPMSLPMLTKLVTFLEQDSSFNETMRLWLAVVCSLCFYGMCRINEVLLMKYGDIQLGLERASVKDPHQKIQFGCFTIRDRKTDHDPHASRTYHLHHLPKEEYTAEALTHVSRWFKHSREKLNHCWSRDEYAFPGLSKVPRGSIKKSGSSGTQQWPITTSRRC
jgi:hypothetical protein